MPWNAYMSQSSFLTPGVALLKVIEGTVGAEFSLFVPTADNHSSKAYPYSALTVILWIIFVVIMPVLFTNLLVCGNSK